jgi:nicotinate phosphoribosyltransferase
MAHSFVQRYDDELDAFRDFAAVRPHDCVLLVDTYDTLINGVPNAIIVSKEMEKQGYKMKGIRLDSGDLAWLAKKSRTMLDDAGLRYVKIAASNQLDEYVIQSLLRQGAPIDIFGVGTSLVTGRPDAALDGVYKLSFANGEPRLKLSESIEKINLPGRKQVYRVLNSDGSFFGADAVTLQGESGPDRMFHPSQPHSSLDLTGLEKKPLLHEGMKNGKRLMDPIPVTDTRKYCQTRLQHLTDEYKRFENPHIYKVGISKALKDQRDQLIAQHRQNT